MTKPPKQADRTPNIGRGLIIAGILMVAAAAGYTVLSAGAHAGRQFAAVTPGLIAVALGLSCVNYALRSLRWSMMCARLGVSGGIGRDTLYYLAGFPMAMTPGKMGEVVRLWLMRRAHGFTYVRTAPLLVADRVFDLLALAALAAIGVGAFAGPIWVALGASGLIAAGSILVLGYPRLLGHVIDLLYRRIRRFPRLFVRLRQVARAFEQLGSLRLALAATVMSIAGWSAEVVTMHLVVGDMGAAISLTDAGFVFAAGMVLGALAFVPGGLGVADVSMIGLLTALGVDFAIATAATIIVRACTLWFAVLIGLIALPLALLLVHRLETARQAARK